MIRLKTKGTFKRLSNYLNKSTEITDYLDLDYYGKKGIDLLKDATPKDTGKTANSWYYEIVKGEKTISLSFNNKNIQNGVPIAIIINFGHGTPNGGWVEGRDYINPVMEPLFNEIENKIRKEATT